MSDLFRVEAEAIDGTIYVYTIEGPSDATDQDAVCEIYGFHGYLLREGVVDVHLGPFNTVTRTTLPE